MTRFVLLCVRNTAVFLVLGLLAGRALAAGDTVTFDPSLIELAFRGIADGNWFLVAGPALTLVTYVVRWLLANRWAAIGESDRWGVAITAALAGAGALAHAWLAGESGLEATTWLGALKVFVMAVATYVVTRKVIASRPTSAPSQAGFARLEAMLVVVMIGAVVACGASAREKTIRTTYVGVVALHAGFTSWDLQHQRELTSGASSVAEGLAKLEPYKAKRQPVLDAFDAAIHALAAAAILNDDPKSLSGGLAAAFEARKAVCSVTGPLPVLCPGGTP